MERIDVLVIGGGITGLSAAYTIAMSGKSVLLLERGTLGSGSTGKAAGILTASTELDQSELKEEEAAFFASATKDLIGFIRKEGLRCGLRRTRSAYMALRQEDIDLLEEEAKHARGARLTRSLKGLPGNPVAVLLEEEVYKIEPLQLVDEMKRMVVRSGGRIRENVTVREYSGNHAQTSAGDIRFGMLIDTCAKHSSALTTTSDAAVVQVPPQTLRSLRGRAFWTADRFQYAYGVPLASDKVLVGGTARLGAHTHPDKRLREWIGQLFPEGRIVHDWCGTITLTPSTLPIITRRGNAISVSAVCGLAAGHAAGVRAAQCALGTAVPLETKTWPYTLLRIPGAKRLGNIWLRSRPLR